MVVGAAGAPTLRAVSLVYLDGELVPAGQAHVPVFDRGLLTGDGVFETLLVRAGRPFAVGRHLARLGRSAAGLGLEIPDAGDLEAAILQVASSVQHHERARLRVTVTGGNGVLTSGRDGARPTVIVAASPIPPAPPAPAVAAVAPWPRNERGALASLKTVSYAENVVALEWARARGATEALFANTVGNLCEGTGSNVFVVLDGMLVTPPLSAGALAGVTRELVLETVDCVEKDVPVDLLTSGAVGEAFLTSTTRAVQAIASVDGRSLAGAEGPVTAAAAAGLAALMARTDEP
jgi:branched-chain amino acid aminotransferase